jgi:hypothetical protein
MRVKVVLEREKGEFRPACGPKDAGTGDLHLTYRSARNRRVAVLQLIAADRQWPNLYEPRLVDLSARRMRFVGSERVGKAWVVQEWVCEVL